MNIEEYGNVDEGGQGGQQINNTLSTKSSLKHENVHVCPPSMFPTLEKNNAYSLEDFGKKYNERIQSDLDKKTPKREKSDRELQYYESPETVDIKLECSKSDVLEWIRKNPKTSYLIMYGTLGEGTFRWLEELASEGIIHEIGDYWEEIK
jgi:hypothetical protein